MRARGGCDISDKFQKTLKKEIIARRDIRHRIIFLFTHSKVHFICFVCGVTSVALFIVAALLQAKGIFTVTTPRETMIYYGLVLSDTPDFARPRHELRSAPVIDMWNITETDLPANIDDIDGEHNGEKRYLAYTFYVKNIGDEAVNYGAVLNLNEMQKQVDEAMRIKIYLNGEPVVYAKQKKDGSGPEPDTIPFETATRLVRYPKKLFNPGDVDKYTVVVWLEGEDPECVNDIMGGFVRMTFNFDAEKASDMAV